MRHNGVRAGRATLMRLNRRAVQAGTTRVEHAWDYTQA
jgi:hypothetical protein